MSDAQNIHKRVTDLVTDVLQTRVPTETTNLIETSILDSLGFVELIARLEREFDIRISLDSTEIGQFRSIASIAEFIAGIPEPAAANRP
jgi:acyl carrier protein